MEPIKIFVNGADAEVVQAPVITTGMVGCPVEFSFDAAWEDLSISALYRAAGICRMEAAITARGTVASEVLQLPGHMLQVGVFGVSEDGTVVIPTVWVDVDYIQEGVDTEAEEAAEPELPVWMQVLAKLNAVITDKLNILPGNSVVMGGVPPDYGPVIWFDTEDKQSGTLTYIDEMNQRYTLMPVTSADNVAGLEAAVTAMITMTKLLAAGPMVLSPHQYGDTLPDPGIPGRIFFKRVSG